VSTCFSPWDLSGPRRRSRSLLAPATRTVVISRPHPGRVFHLPQLEVLWAVVVTPSVPVMHALVWEEVPAQRLFHDQDVLQDVRVVLRCAGMAGSSSANVSVGERSAALPNWRLSTATLALCGRCAVPTTEPSALVKAEIDGAALLARSRIASSSCYEKATTRAVDPSDVLRGEGRRARWADLRELSAAEGARALPRAELLRPSRRLKCRAARALHGQERPATCWSRALRRARYGAESLRRICGRELLCAAFATAHHWSSRHARSSWMFFTR
jgi:hypothetical protein